MNWKENRVYSQNFYSHILRKFGNQGKLKTYILIGGQAYDSEKLKIWVTIQTLGGTTRQMEKRPLFFIMIISCLYLLAVIEKYRHEIQLQI